MGHSQIVEMNRLSNAFCRVCELAHARISFRKINYRVGSQIRRVGLNAQGCKVMRKNDKDQSRVNAFRSSERFVRIDNAWWFSTREGDEGPFATRDAARDGLRRYIAAQEMVEKHQQKVEKVREKTNRGDPTVWNTRLDAS